MEHKNLDVKFLKHKIINLLNLAGTIADKRIISYKSKKSTNFKNNEGKVYQKFDELFNGHDLITQISNKSYVERVLKEKRLNGLPLLFAGFLFFKTITKPGFFTTYNNYSIKLFATCLQLSQKFYFDRPFSAKFMCQLLGVSTKKLLKREIFIYGDNVLNYDLEIENKSIKKFIKFLGTL